MNIPGSILTLLAGIALTLVSFWFGYHHGLLPVAASEEAGLIDSLFNAMMTISIGLFLLVQGVILVSVFKFRRRAGDDTDAPPVHGNIPLEILWTVIPVILVLGISVYSFEIYGQMGGLNPMDHAVAHTHSTQQVAQGRGSAIAAPLPDSGADPTALTAEMAPDQPMPDSEFVVNALGLQYAWIFTYPDTGVVSGELHLPLGRQIKVNISASDVIHALWVPQFRLKQDAVPGRQTEVQFTPTKLGEYPVICAELCGAYHGAMKTRAIVQTPEDFDQWLNSQKVASQDALSEAIAATPATLPPAQFLAPYAQEMGIGPDTIQPLTAVHAAHPAAS